MKMVMVVYSQAADYDVIAAFKQAGIKSYTKIEHTCGEGTGSEPKLRTHSWPGENNILFLAMEDPAISEVVTVIQDLRAHHPRAGVKGFIMPMEEIL